MFFLKFKKENDGYNAILNVINITSRKAYSEPMKGKDLAEVTRAFDKIKSQIPRIDNMTSDNEASFNKVIKKYKDITHWKVEVNDKTKVGIVERFNRTIRDQLTKYFKLKKTRRWIDVLPKIIKNYNSTEHSTIGIAPNDFTKADGKRIRKEAAKRSAKAFNELRSYKIGDKVRILKRKKVFDKGQEHWSKQIYTIEAKALPLSFKIKSPNGVILDGSFKTWQLQKISESETPKNLEKEPIHHKKVINSREKFNRLQRKEASIDNHRLIPEKPKRVPKTVDPLIGKRIKVYWPEYKRWYTGRVVSKSDPKDGGTHDVKYDDDDEAISEILVPSSLGKVVEYKLI